MLRRLVRQDEPQWLQYRAYLTRTYTDDCLPQIILDGKVVLPGPVFRVYINGTISFYHNEFFLDSDTEINHRLHYLAEMEGRISIGSANLSTFRLTYGALQTAGI